MVEMAWTEKLWCRSAPWLFVARRYVLPWALQGAEPSGRGLEIGAGSGLTGEQLLRSFPDLELVVTDLDQDMLARGRRLLEDEPRATVRTSDATDLGFDDGSFDHVFSFIMLHHVVRWEKAFAEAVRVLKPGGWLIGYDLLDSRWMRILHRLEGTPARFLQMDALHAVLEDLPVDRVILTRGGPFKLVRFKVRKAVNA